MIFPENKILLILLFNFAQKLKIWDHISVSILVIKPIKNNKD